MFIDTARIEFIAGNGGDGAVAWRREKFEPSGGPDGGDGGDGGSIILLADTGVETLYDFKYRQSYKAPDGEKGKSKKQYGRKGEDIVLRVPVGTVVREEESGLAVADLIHPGQSFTVVKGGKGGKGNPHFRSSIRQAPRFAQPGGKGQRIKVRLEIKLIADVGLIGFPNVGKSTTLSILTHARPKIANYPFTTLMPNLGVVDIDQGKNFILADMPGLIEGASSGAGLGEDFLRHIERTRLLVQLIDMAGSEGRDPVEDYLAIEEELRKYDERLPEKVKMVIANKMDLAGAEENLELFRRFLKESGREGIRLFPASAATTQGMKEIRYGMWELIKDIPRTFESLDEELVDINRFFRQTDKAINVYRQDGIIYVKGEPVKTLSRKLILTDEESVIFFERSLERMGVMDRIRELEPETAETIDVEGFQFDWE